jgi:hypothetical protein
MRFYIFPLSTCPSQAGLVEHNCNPNAWKVEIEDSGSRPAWGKLSKRLSKTN